MPDAATRTKLAVWLLACALVAGACGQTAAPGTAYTLPDATADLHGPADVAPAGDDTTAADAATDAAEAETTVDVAASQDTAPMDTPPQDAPPHIQPLSPLTLQQGASTTLDLNPLISDLEDPDDQLKGNPPKTAASRFSLA